MLRAALLTIALLCGAAGLAAAPAAADNAQITASLQQAYTGQCDNLVRGDLDAYRNVLSPAYVSQSATGTKLTRDQVIANIKALMAQGLALARCTATIDTLTQSADTVTATVEQAFYGTIGKSKSPFEIAGSSVDTWTGADAGTLIETSSVSIWTTLSINGQIVQRTGQVPSPSPLPASSPRR